VLLSDVERWEAAVPMDTRRGADRPGGVDPIVQANAASGFRMGVVRVTADEYEAVVALSREARRT
jgi:hypothetical protein